MEKTVQLYPLYDVWHKPWWQMSWFYYAAGLFLGAMLVGFVWYTLKWYKRKKAKKKPWEIALIRINELQTITAGNTEISSKEVYVRLTIILKTYLYARYGFNVESKTDEELLIYLEQTSLNKDLIELFREIVEDGVQAKFAQLTMLKETIAKDLQYCTEIINKTIPPTP